MKSSVVLWLALISYSSSSTSRYGSAVADAATPTATNLPTVVLTHTRRLLNLGGLLGSAPTTSQCPYDRIMGHPVFQVTTAWGSAYMNMEKLTDGDDTLGPRNPTSIAAATTTTSGGGGKKVRSVSDEQNEYRTVSLYFMDPDDALATHAELKQLEQMKKSDIRITSVSLAKAVRSAANLGSGLVTGYPVERLTGNLKSVQEGGSLRHKILPPKRQLFYAARCIGRERVGLFGENPTEDATSAVMGNSALEGLNLLRRREKRDRKSGNQSNNSNSKKTLMQIQNAHMEGHTGIPVFWAQGMYRRPPLVKRLMTGNAQETPMFFNYEDLMDAWEKMHKTQSNSKQTLSPAVPTVEVFNLWDLLTSMEKEAWRQKKSQKFDWAKPLRQRLGKIGQPTLDDITFVPSSRAIDYKETITARGNGKARLRPMR